MKLSHAAALALVGWYLMTPSLPRAAEESVAVPRTADAEMRWYSMSPPMVSTGPGSGVGRVFSDAPISRWRIDRTFQTKKECDAHIGGQELCVSADDLAHARALYGIGWLLLTAPQDDATAPLSLWTAVKALPGEGGRTIIFPTEEACNSYRNCLYSLCMQPGTAYTIRELQEWESGVPERTRRMNLTSRCVPADHPRLNEK